jgi:hypothetical protein
LVRSSAWPEREVGDPLSNIQLIDDPARNLLVIMKDGKVVKNTLRS